MEGDYVGDGEFAELMETWNINTHNYVLLSLIEREVDR